MLFLTSVKMTKKYPEHGNTIHGLHGDKTDSMYGYAIAVHESRELKQARPVGQYVDLLRHALATPSQGQV